MSSLDMIPQCVIDKEIEERKEKPGTGNPFTWGSHSWYEWEKAAGRDPKKEYYEKIKRSNFEASSRLEDK